MTLQDLLNQWFEIAADDLDVAKGCVEKYSPSKACNCLLSFSAGG